MTFPEAADSYIAAGGSDRFILETRADGRNVGLAIHFQGKKLLGITQADLDAAASTLYPGKAPDTLNRQCYTPFIAVWNHAVTNQWAELRKWRRPRKPKGTAIVPRAKRSGTAPVTFDQAARFVAAMSPAPAMVMTALFYTGMRPIELFALEATDVNVPGRWLVIANSKTGEPRGIPMHEFLVPLFDGLLNRRDLSEEPRIFRTPRNEPYPLTEDGGGQLKTAIKGAHMRLARLAHPDKDPKKLVVKDSPLYGISPYTARHTVSTQLVVNGVHPHIKDQILGHAADDMSRHYTHVPQAPLIEAINTLPRWEPLEWMADPVGWTRKLAEGTGARNDLKEKRA